jgi:ABC-type Fe3+/spermidine/putrescine transport system ATPase subunit
VFRGTSKAATRCVLIVCADLRINHIDLGADGQVIRKRCSSCVASFVGDVNVLHARLGRIDGATAEAALGSARVLVPMATLQGAAAGDMIDLFVRPEELRVAEHGMVVAAYGVVAAQNYQGGHVDLYVDMPEVASGRVLLRVPGIKAVSLWPAGARIGIALAADQVQAFKPAPARAQPIGTHILDP